MSCDAPSYTVDLQSDLNPELDPYNSRSAVVWDSSCILPGASDVLTILARVDFPHPGFPWIHSMLDLSPSSVENHFLYLGWSHIHSYVLGCARPIWFLRKCMPWKYKLAKHSVFTVLARNRVFRVDYSPLYSVACRITGRSFRISPMSW